MSKNKNEINILINKYPEVHCNGFGELTFLSYISTIHNIPLTTWFIVLEQILAFTFIMKTELRIRCSIKISRTVSLLTLLHPIFSTNCLSGASSFDNGGVYSLGESRFHQFLISLKTKEKRRETSYYVAFSAKY